MLSEQQKAATQKIVTLIQSAAPAPCQQPCIQVRISGSNNSVTIAHRLAAQAQPNQAAQPPTGARTWRATKKHRLNSTAHALRAKPDANSAVSCDASAKSQCSAIQPELPLKSITWPFFLCPTHRAKAGISPR